MATFVKIYKLKRAGMGLIAWYNYRLYPLPCRHCRHKHKISTAVDPKFCNCCLIARYLCVGVTAAVGQSANNAAPAYQTRGQEID
jgi:hypothetical protein